MFTSMTKFGIQANSFDPDRTAQTDNTPEDIKS